MRPRNRLSADQWGRRLDACMRMVLADPASFPEATVWWARWRRADSELISAGRCSGFLVSACWTQHAGAVTSRVRRTDVGILGILGTNF